MTETDAPFNRSPFHSSESNLNGVQRDQSRAHISSRCAFLLKVIVTIAVVVQETDKPWLPCLANIWLFIIVFYGYLFLLNKLVSYFILFYFKEINILIHQEHIKLIKSDSK